MGEGPQGAAAQPAPPLMDVQCCSRLPLAHFNIINLSGKFGSILKHTLGSKLNLYV